MVSFRSISKSENRPAITTILLIWLTSLGVIFLLPDTTSYQKYLIVALDSSLTLIYVVYTRRDKITKRHFQHLLYFFQTLFFLYVPYVFWSFGAALWQAPPVLNGLTVVTWLGLFIVAMDIVGLASLGQGIVVGWTWYNWARTNPKTKKQKP